MKMKHLILLLALVLSVGQGYAQQEEIPSFTSEAYLKPGDVDRFLKDFKPMMTELKLLGDGVNSQQTVSQLQAMRTSEELQTILDKYGWEEHYNTTFSVIVLGYAEAKLVREFENMTVEQKNMLKELGMDKNKMKYVHESDLKKIMSRFDALDKLFNELNLN